MSHLRDVLREHADAVEDHAHHERVAAVQQRVRRVRHRRTAAVSLVAVIALAAVGAVVALPRDHRPQPATVPTTMAGHAVPPTTKSYGATYTYTRGFTAADGHLEVRLPDSRRGVLVRAASVAGPGEGQLVLRAGGDQPWVVPAGGFGPFEYVGGQTRTVRLELRGDAEQRGVALAVYTWSEPAPGYSRDGLVFPAVVDGGRLAGAFIGSPGQGRGTAHVRALANARRVAGATGFRPLVLHAFCNHVPAGSALTLSAAGVVSVRIGCGPAGPQDAAHGDGSFTSYLPTHALDLTVTLTDSRGHRIAVPGDARIGLGVYARGPGPGTVTMPSRVSRDGHEWQLAGTVHLRSRLATWRRIPVGMDDLADPMLVAWGTPGTVRGSLRARVPGQGDIEDQAGGVGSAVVSNGDPDAAISLRGRGLAPHTLVVVGTYRLAD